MAVLSIVLVNGASLFLGKIHLMLLAWAFRVYKINTHCCFCLVFFLVSGLVLLLFSSLLHAIILAYSLITYLSIIITINGAKYRN